MNLNQRQSCDDYSARTPDHATLIAFLCCETLWKGALTFGQNHARPLMTFAVSHDDNVSRVQMTRATEAILVHLEEL